MTPKGLFCILHYTTVSYDTRSRQCWPFHAARNLTSFRTLKRHLRSPRSHEKDVHAFVSDESRTATEK